MLPVFRNSPYWAIFRLRDHFNSLYRRISQFFLLLTFVKSTRGIPISVFYTPWWIFTMKYPLCIENLVHSSFIDFRDDITLSSL